MLAYKFLSEGALGLFSGFRWSLGEWLEIQGELVPSRRGVHACRVGDLPHWLNDELWVAELDGELLEQDRMVVARRGRLVERIHAWTREVADEFAHVAVAHGPDYRGRSEDIESWGYDAPSSAYMAAHAAGCEAEVGGGKYWPAFRAERAWQAEWLRERLRLPAEESLTA